MEPTTLVERDDALDRLRDVFAVAALRPDQTVVTIHPDSGLEHLSA